MMMRLDPFNYLRYQCHIYANRVTLAQGNLLAVYLKPRTRPIVIVQGITQARQAISHIGQGFGIAAIRRKQTSQHIAALRNPLMHSEIRQQRTFGISAKVGKLMPNPHLKRPQQVNF